MVSDRTECLPSEVTGTSRKKSYSLTLSKELEDVTKEITLQRELEISGKREGRDSRQRSENRKDIDIFFEARNVIGLFPIKARHILNFSDVIILLALKISLS